MVRLRVILRGKHYFLLVFLNGSLKRYPISMVMWSLIVTPFIRLRLYRFLDSKCSFPIEALRKTRVNIYGGLMVKICPSNWKIQSYAHVGSVISRASARQNIYFRSYLRDWCVSCKLSERIEWSVLYFWVMVSQGRTANKGQVGWAEARASHWCCEVEKQKDLPNRSKVSLARYKKVKIHRDAE